MMRSEFEAQSGLPAKASWSKRRQTLLKPLFGFDQTNRATPPIDILQSQSSNFSGSQPEPGKAQDDGEIALWRGVRARQELK
jgi:hypothetical protein